MGQQDHANRLSPARENQRNIPNEDDVDSDAEHQGNHMGNNQPLDEELLREQRNMQEHQIARQMGDLDNREQDAHPENEEQNDAAQHSRIDHVKLAQQFIDLVS